MLDLLFITHNVILIKKNQEFKKDKSLGNLETFPEIFIDDIFFGGYDELSKQVKFDYLNSFK